MFCTGVALIVFMARVDADESIQQMRDRFPPREVARQAMQFNRAWRLHAQNKQLMERHNFWYWQEAITDTDYLYHCWDWLHAAQGGEGRDEAYWRASFKHLHDLIGCEYFLAGRMPPNVPPRYFHYTD